MADIYRLTLLPYLQAWETDSTSPSLLLHVLLFPTGNPVQSLTHGLGIAGPAIADSNIVLTANLSKAVDQLPLPHQRRSRRRTGAGHAVELRGVRGTRLALSPGRTRGSAGAFDRQYLAEIPDPELPQCFRVHPAAHAARSRRRLFSLYPPVPGYRAPTETDAAREELGRGAGLRVRQPLVLRRAGLLHDVTVGLPTPDFYRDGGWLFFTLAARSDYANAVGEPNFFRSFATRVPSLSVAQRRPVFTAVLFPVYSNAAAAAAVADRYDDVFREAVLFDDGFAKIVHATQPRGMQHLDEDGTGPRPIIDYGVSLGWDDEGVLIGQNRQIGLNPDGTEPAEAPRGVVGYRVDVREVGQTAWTSLSRVHSDHWRVGPLDLGPLTCELRTEVHPRRLNNRLWLPAYFASWVGGSPVVATDADQALAVCPTRHRPPTPRLVSMRRRCATATTTNSASAWSTPPAAGQCPPASRSVPAKRRSRG